MELTIGITAGGKSTRFGEDKRFVLFRGKSLLENAVLAFSGYQDLIVSVDRLENAVLPSGCCAKVVVDQVQETGPIEALYQILKASEHEAAFIFPIDMPLVGPEVARFLSTYLEPEIDVVCPVVGGREYPLASIYRKRVLPAIEKQRQSGNYRLRSLLGSLRTKYVDISLSGIDPKVFANVNTREDLQRLSRPVVFSVSGYKKSGKTTVVEYLLRRFVEDGFKVGAIKHDAHTYSMDIPGTDSSRFYETGADVAIFSPDSFTLNTRGRRSLDQILLFFSDYDVVIVEGVKASDLPKIQLYREGDNVFSNVFLTLSGKYDLESIYSSVRSHFSI